MAFVCKKFHIFFNSAHQECPTGVIEMEMLVLSMFVCIRDVSSSDVSRGVLVQWEDELLVAMVLAKVSSALQTPGRMDMPAMQVGRLFFKHFWFPSVLTQAFLWPALF